MMDLDPHEPDFFTSHCSLTGNPQGQGLSFNADPNLSIVDLGAKSPKIRIVFWRVYG